MKITDQTVTPFNIYVAEYFKDPLPAMIYQQILYECTKGFRASFRHSETQCAVAQMSINDFYTRFPRRDIRTIYKALRLLLEAEVIMSDLCVPYTQKSLRFTISPNMPKELQEIEMNNKFLKQFVTGYKISDNQKSFAEESISGMYYPRTLYMQEYGMLPGIIFDRLFFLMIIQRNIPGFIPEYLPEYDNVALKLPEKKLNELFPFLVFRGAYKLIKKHLILDAQHLIEYDTSLYGINYTRIINDSVPYYSYASHWESFGEYLDKHKKSHAKKQTKMMQGIHTTFAEEYIIPQNKEKAQKDSIDNFNSQVKLIAVNNSQHTEIIDNNFIDTDIYEDEGHFIQDYMDATRCYLAEYEGLHIPYDPYELSESFLLLNHFLLSRNTEKFDENYLNKINLPLIQYLDSEFNIGQPEHSTENLNTQQKNLSVLRGLDSEFNMGQPVPTTENLSLQQKTLPVPTTSNLSLQQKTCPYNRKPVPTTENLSLQHGAIIIRDIKDKKDIKGSRGFFFTNSTVGQISAKFAHCFFSMLNAVPTELVKPVKKEKKEKKRKKEEKIIATGMTSCEKNIISDLENFENTQSEKSSTEIILIDLLRLKKFYFKILEKCRLLEKSEHNGKNGRVYHTLPKYSRFAMDVEMLKRDALNILCLYPWQIQVTILVNVLLLTPERLHDKWADDYGKAYVQTLYAILQGRVPTTDLKGIRPVTLPPELTEIAFKGIPEKEHVYIAFYDIRKSLALAGHPYEVNTKYLIPSPRVYPGIKEYEHVKKLSYYTAIIKQNLFEYLGRNTL